ncbi:MAG TPA: glycosyltransferase family 4 protein [Chitinophagaceae bacterium]|nr:glycosyltransferase family 4 protein [Chitinophagaceae bacterium]
MIDSSKHIALLVSRLDLPGGIERAAVNTATLFARKGNQVTLIILDETDKSFYPIDPSIKIIQVPLSFGITKEGNIITRKMKLLTDVLKLKRILRETKPDIIISTEYPFTVAAVLTGTQKKARLFAWEHHHHAWLQKNKFWTTLYTNACKRLDGIICLNKLEATYYEKFCPVHIIPNFIENRSGNLSSCNAKQIVSVGWLIPRKGIDLMLAAAKMVLTKHPDWTWKLIGDGEMKPEVLDFIEKENLQGRFILQLPVNELIESEYLSSSIFVLSSRFEAFPMVLLEAMSYGLPCVSFDCPSGPSDIICDDIDGLLVEKENIEKLSSAISSLIDFEQKRKEMGTQAAKNIQRFAPDTVYQLWKEKVIL